MMVRVAVAGIGSCCSSFAQLIEMARSTNEQEALAGISHPTIGSIAVQDISIVAGFDVDETKVDKDLAQAISINDAVLHLDHPSTGVRVLPGPLADGVMGPISEVITVADSARRVTIDDVISTLRRQQVDVLICCIPSGSKEAVRTYAKAAAAAGVAFVNCTAAPAAHDLEVAELFEAAGVPLLGDDLRSHVGATTVHTLLLELLSSRGVEITNTYQLNVGGNHDFLNLSDKTRSDWKVSSKMRALHASAPVSHDTWAGPNGFIPGLGDHKVCHLTIQGKSVLGSAISIDMKLQVEDSPNAAGVMVNAVRVAAFERTKGTGGVVHDPAAFLFKSPVLPLAPSEAEKRFTSYLASMS